MEPTAGLAKFTLLQLWVGPAPRAGCDGLPRGRRIPITQLNQMQPHYHMTCSAATLQAT